MGPIDRKDLTFTTLIQSLDVFFAVDTTASMGGPIGNLRASLRDTIIPAVKKAAVKDAWFGVGAIEDFPVMPYGIPGFMPPALDDQPFILIAPMTGDVMAAQAAIEGLILPKFLPTIIAPRGAGGDMPEAHLEALYQVATGEGLMVPGVANIPAHKGTGKGGVEFREGAQPVVVTISDVPSHTKDEPADACQTNYAGPVAQAAHTRAQTEAVLSAVCAKVIGIATMWPDSFYKGPACTPAADMTRLAQATGALVPPQAWDLPGTPHRLRRRTLLHGREWRRRGPRCGRPVPAGLQERHQGDRSGRPGDRRDHPARPLRRLRPGRHHRRRSAADGTQHRRLHPQRGPPRRGQPAPAAGQPPAGDPGRQVHRGPARHRGPLRD